jgi:membrane fusion protein, multidrug efflux system
MKASVGGQCTGLKLLVAGIGLGFFGFVTAQTPKAAPLPPSNAAQAIPASPATVTRLPDVPAADVVRVLLIPDGETTLSSPVTAKIKMLSATIGASIATGQTLVSFDCDEPVARLTMANAELAGAVESHEAKIRMQGLEQASDVEVALAASAAAKARGQVALQKAQVAQCTVVAPWSGRVSKVHVRNHMSVTPGQAMLDLVKSGPLRIKLNVPSRLIGKIRAGTLMDVSIDETGKTYQARIQAFNSRVDPVSQTIEIEAAISKYHPELLPGMSGVANLSSLK